MHGTWNVQHVGSQAQLRLPYHDAYVCDQSEFFSHCVTELFWNLILAFSYNGLNKLLTLYGVVESGTPNEKRARVYMVGQCKSA